MKLLAGIIIGVVITLICVAVYWVTHVDVDIDLNIEDIGNGKW